MITTMDIIQIIYELPSLVLLIFFVISLTKEIIFSRNPIYNNQFFPFILFKGYIDIFTVFSTFICSRCAKMNVFGSFYENNRALASFYYATVGLNYTSMYFIALITSFNRFLAISYPLLIDKWFSKTKIIVYIFVSFTVGLLCGIGFIIIQPFYFYFNEIKGYYITFKSRYAPYLLMCYTICILLSIAIFAGILNAITIYKLLKYFKGHRNKNVLKDVSLIIYSILNFISFLLFFIYNMSRIINYLTFKSILVEVIAIEAIYWIIDLEVFGLFYASLFLSTPLKNLILFKKFQNNINNATVKMINIRSNNFIS